METHQEINFGPKVLALAILLCLNAALASTRSQAQCKGEERKTIEAREDTLKSTPIRKSWDELVFAKNNVNYYYRFSAGECAEMYIIANKKDDHEVKRQLSDRGFALDEQYNYRKDAWIAQVIYMDSRYMQVRFYEDPNPPKFKNWKDSIQQYMNSGKKPPPVTPKLPE